MELEQIREISQTTDPGKVNKLLKTGFRIKKILSHKTIIEGQELILPMYILVK